MASLARWLYVACKYLTYNLIKLTVLNICLGAAMEFVDLKYCSQRKVWKSSSKGHMKKRSGKRNSWITTIIINCRNSWGQSFLRSKFGRVPFSGVAGEWNRTLAPVRGSSKETYENWYKLTIKKNYNQWFGWANSSSLRLQVNRTDFSQSNGKTGLHPLERWNTKSLDMGSWK